MAPDEWRFGMSQTRLTPLGHPPRYPPIMSSELIVRRATTHDVAAIRALVDQYAGKVLLVKETVTLYEDVQEFWVAVDGERIVGCGALHILWQDLGEIRTVAVDRDAKRRGIGGLIVQRLIEHGRDLGIERIFVLTFETSFFERHGFREIEGTPVTPEVYIEMRRSYDRGIAEFLDLEYVKPNTLGNTRMLLTL
jgi:amino-acid N-acetyltransferase